MIVSNHLGQVALTHYHEELSRKKHYQYSKVGLGGRTTANSYGHEVVVKVEAVVTKEVYEELFHISATSTRVLRSKHLSSTKEVVIDKGITLKKRYEHLNEYFIKFTLKQFVKPRREE